MNLLGQLCTFQGGGAFPQNEQGASGGEYPFAKVRDLAGMVGSEWRGIGNWITEEQRLRLRSKIVPEESIVFAKIGEGLRGERLAVAPQSMLIDNNLMAAVPQESTVSPMWLYYKFKVLGLSQYAVGSAMPYLKQSDLAAVAVDVPPRSVQEGVAGVLLALDNAIAANIRLVERSDDLREALWLSISRDASTVPLSSLARFVNGGAFTKGATGSGRIVVRIAELNSGIGPSTVFNDLEVPDSKVVRAGDLLMSWSGSLTAVRWFRDDAIVNQHIFKVIPNEDLSVWAVACAVETKLDEFRGIAAGKATTMGHIKRADLDSPVARPEISDRLNEVGAALWGRALAAEKENLRLAATRDELLPLLMSGKITLKDAEKTVEEVV